MRNFAGSRSGSEVVCRMLVVGEGGHLLAVRGCRVHLLALRGCRVHLLALRAGIGGFTCWRVVLVLGGSLAGASCWYG